uniref:PHB domain-containing protein n=1 Tax=Globodera pallida TaxID=36090 RepID=A0A183CT19_GLOPA
GAYEAALAYSKERKQFGKAICDFQAIAFKLADMYTDVQASSLLTFHAAALKDAGEKVTLASSVAKYHSSETAVRVANEAVQIFGGYGFVKDYPAEKFYRDSKLCTIGEGTSEIQKIVVPQQSAYILERLGKFYAVLQPGVNFIIPFFDRIAYKYTLKEAAVDIPEQICITRDNVQVRMDGVIFIQVIDPRKAAYGISDYTFAVIQLAQTTMRSEIGKLDLDKTFEERMTINRAVVESIDEAATGWGVKVLRYEIKNITPPQSVLNAMEKQMQAERERRAVILQSDGEKQAAINVAEGQKQKV